jgi:hypothetical protein
LRCQPMKVLGETTAKAFRQSNQRPSHTSVSRVGFRVAVALLDFREWLEIRACARDLPGARTHRAPEWNGACTNSAKPISADLAWVRQTERKFGVIAISSLQSRAVDREQVPGVEDDQIPIFRDAHYCDCIGPNRRRGWLPFKQLDRVYTDTMG